MTTYQQTTRNQFDTPAAVAGERPNVPADFQKLAQELDDRLGVAGAEYAANLTAINAIPTARCFEGKTAFASDTRYRYRYTSGAWRLISTPWQTFATLASGITAQAGSYTPSWKISDGDVQLSGAVTKASGAVFADANALITLPTAVQPASNVFGIVDAQGGYIVGLAITGTSLSVHSVKGGTPTWIALDGFNYRLA